MAAAAAAAPSAADPTHVKVLMNDAPAKGAAAAPAAGGSGGGGGVSCGGGRRLAANKVAAIALVVAALVVIGVGVGVGVGLGTKDHGGGGSGTDQTGYTLVDLGGKVGGRTYFIAADKINWDYAPAGMNLCYQPDVAAMFLPAGVTRVGGTFVKAQYREYTDSTFQNRKQVYDEWAHLGNVGPPMFAAVGDVLRVVFKNNLAFPVNMAPSGGLVAWDGAGRSSARTAPVAPGDTATYLWTVPEAAGPPPGASVTSRMWLYRSTVDPYEHDNAGLVGPVIVAARDAAGTDGRATDVDRDIVAIFQVAQERASPYLYEHSQTLTAGVSYTKMAINGYSWCNMPLSDILLRTGQKVRWHVASIGSSDSLHNYHWHGHVVELNGHHVDQFTAIPAASYSVNMVPDEPGTWMFHCHVNFHMDGGMVNTYTVVGQPTPFPAGGTVRRFYVAAEEVDWSYTGPDNMQACGLGDHVPVALAEGINGYQYAVGPSTDPIRLGHTYRKALFVEYTDASLSAVKERSGADAYLGMLGPVMRAVVGDTIEVVLTNRATFNVSMHPHGVRYNKGSEGTLYNDGTSADQKGDDGVQPGQTYTYRWLIPERSGPGPADPSSMLWMYHSHLDETAETYAGLAGAIIVTAKDKATSSTNLMPTDVDRELVIFFTVFNEIDSSLFMANLARVSPETAANATLVDELVNDPDFQEHMLKHGINGNMYCNMPHLNFTAGDKVRLHVMVLGTVEDMHTPNMGGPRFDYNGQHTDSIQISPGGMVSADVYMASPGNFELQCRVADHVLAGMRAIYTILPNPQGDQTPPSNVTRTYYVQAETVEWNYAPGGYQRCTESDLSYQSGVYLDTSSTTIGSTYLKAVYREYTDATFTTLKPAPAYQGTMGPMIIAEVGDMLEVVFRNALTDLEGYDVNISPGGGLIDAGSDAGCGAVAAGGNCTYRWMVPENAGPSVDDFSTVVYGYTSSVDIATAPSAGLTGALVVAARGALAAGPNGTLLPRGVDLMVPLYWQVVDENSSPYVDANSKAAGLNMTMIENDEVAAGNYDEGNRMHSINGYVYCNMPRVTVRTNTTVRWVLVAYGTEGDFHSPYFQGQSVQVDLKGYSTLASLMPSIARVADMHAGDPGVWLLYCDVHDHYQSGMMAQFEVLRS